MRWVAGLAFVVVLLAGCGGKASGANKVQLADGTQVSLDLPEAQQPDEEGFVGAVSGVVVDEAVYPVPGATIAIPGLRRETVSDDTGRFVLEDVAPGLWAVQASKRGHDTGAGTLNVRAGEVAKAVLMAPRQPDRTPYHTTTVIDEVHSLVDAVVFEAPTQHVVPLDPEPASLVVESLWQAVEPVVPGDDALQWLLGPETDPEARATGTGPNPLRLAHGPDWFPPQEHAVRVMVAPLELTTPPESTGRLFVTVFYREPAPEGWSLVEGDA